MTKYLSSNSAATYLGYSTATLRNVRHTGTLAGVEAPTYKKMGKSIRYDMGVLDSWLAQFSDLANTQQGKGV
jgi:Helix-turn-helix domain